MNKITDIEIRAALQKVREVYGLEFAKKLEQLYRNETKHFKSGNFAITKAAGMEAFANTIPFGWNSLSEFWKANPSYEPIKLHSQKENTSALATASKIPKRFLVFKTVEASMMTVSEFIKIKNKGWGRWFTLLPEKQKEYNDYLNTITPRFCNAII